MSEKNKKNKIMKESVASKQEKSIDDGYEKPTTDTPDAIERLMERYKKLMERLSKT